MHIINISGEIVFASSSPKVRSVNDICSFTCSIPGNLMNDGTYSVMALIVNNSEVLFRMDNMLNFELTENERESGWFGKWPGSIRPELIWNVNSFNRRDEVSYGIY
jgi:lipopolysaccharide transport system ATP-binding protein